MADEFNETILHNTARRNDGVDRLDRLLKHGFGVDLRSADGRTALHSAADSGSIKALKFLLSSGANIDSQDNDGWSALHYAAAAGLTDVVDALVDKGANMNARTTRGITGGFSAMQLAAWYDPASIVRQLFEHGGDATIRGNDNDTLLLCAFGSEAMVNLVLELNGRNDINVFANTGLSPLTAACMQESSKVVKILLDNGADVNAASNTGYTALHAAVLRDNKEIVSFLLQYGADPNSEDTFFGTPYTMAVENLSGTRTELLSHGGDISMESAYGRTPASILDSLGLFEAEVGNLAQPPPPPPVSLADMRARQIRRLKASIGAALENHRTRGNETWPLGLIGHLLGFLGNLHDSRIAYEQTVSWDDNRNCAVHTSRIACPACHVSTGSLFICTCCSRAMFCLGCFSQHPAYRRVLFEQLLVNDIFASGGRDEKWAAFLDINGFMGLRYELFRCQDKNDVATLEGRQGRILTLLEEKISTTKNEPQTVNVRAKFPYCQEEHEFICVPGWERLDLSAGVVNTKGQTVEGWLEELNELYGED